MLFVGHSGTKLLRLDDHSPTHPLMVGAMVSEGPGRVECMRPRRAVVGDRSRVELPAPIARDGVRRDVVVDPSNRIVLSDDHSNYRGGIV